MSLTDPLTQDLRFAFRALSKRPAPALLAVLTLALGIGANAAIFSVVDAVLLAPPPFAEPEELVVVWGSNPELARSIGLPDTLPVSAPDFYDWQAQAKGFEHLALIGPGAVSLTGDGEPERVGAVSVSGDFFAALGARPALGRTLQPADDTPEAPGVALLSHGLWQRRFGGDPGAVGRTVQLEGLPYTVVGVMPPEFTFPAAGHFPIGYGLAAAPEVWLPLGLGAQSRASRGARNYLAVGRLRAGTGIAAAQEEMGAISGRIARAHPDGVGWSVRLEPLAEQMTGSVRSLLLLLWGAVGLVLLIACGNVANLLLAQAAARQKEVAVRTALGAGRRRLLCQLLTESLLLAGAGGVLGLLLAVWGLQALVAALPATLPGLQEAALDGRLLGFAAAVSLLAGLLAGLAPALQTTAGALATSLREGTRGGTGAVRSRRTAGLLVAGELALAVLLVIGAGLLLRSFARLTGVDPGFRPAGVLAFELELPQSRYKREQRAPFYQDVLGRLAALPGVTAAGAVSSLPMGGDENIEGLVIEGRPQPKPGEDPLADYRSATPGYFAALGVPLLRGRLFDGRDGFEAPRVGIVDENLARAFWPGEDPLGKRLRTSGTSPDIPWITVVGVVGTVRHSGLHAETRPQLYVPHLQRPTGDLALVVRTAGDPLRLAAAARAAVHAVDRDLPVSGVRSMEEVVGASVAPRRFALTLLGLFAGLALLLAAVGIYGVTATSVGQRTREMGLRMALGAKRGEVLGLVIREAGVLALGGIAAGLVLAFGLTRLMASQLFGVRATDPATFAAVAVFLLGVALAAAWLPGRKATRVDPMVALRAE